LEVDDEGAEAVDAKRKEGREVELRREDATERGSREVLARRGAGNVMLPRRGDDDRWMQEE
jgi:hypothetical protein